MSPFFLCYLICFRKINYLCMPFIKWLYIIFRVERKLNGRGGSQSIPDGYTLPKLAIIDAEDLIYMACTLPRRRVGCSPC